MHCAGSLKANLECRKWVYIVYVDIINPEQQSDGSMAVDHQCIMGSMYALIHSTCRKFIGATQKVFRHKKYEPFCLFCPVQDIGFCVRWSSLVPFAPFRGSSYLLNRLGGFGQCHSWECLWQTPVCVVKRVFEHSIWESELTSRALIESYHSWHQQPLHWSFSRCMPVAISTHPYFQRQIHTILMKLLHA